MLSVITSAILILISIFVLFTNRRKLGIIVVSISFFSNLISILLYYLSPTLSRVNVMVATREVTIYVLLITAFVSIKKFKFPITHPTDKIYLLLLTIFSVLIVICIPQNGISALLMGRELLFPLAIYFFFRLIRIEARHAKLIIRFIIVLAIFTAALGVGEYIYVNFVNQKFWEQIKVSGYLAQKYGSFDESYPLSWVNYLPVFIGLPPNLRIVGLMLDPLVTGHFLACSFAIAFYWIRRSIKYFVLLLIGIGVLLTFSKASLLICFITFGSQTFLIRNRLLRNLGMSAFGTIIIMIGLLLLSTGDDNFTHFGSFKAGVMSVLQNPLGNGIGSTGYFNLLATGRGAVSAIDTTFSVYIYQMGILGVLTLVLTVFTPVLALLQQVKRMRQLRQYKPLPPMCLAIFVAYSILGFSSSAAFTAVPIFIPMMLLAINQSFLPPLKQMKLIYRKSYSPLNTIETQNV